MKKSFYFALALTAGLFASCSSDELTSQAPGLDVNDNEAAQIQIGVNNPGVTRGTGTVGSLSDNLAANKWAGQTFNLFMFEKGTFKPAKKTVDDGTGGTTQENIYYNAEMITPNDGSTAASYVINNEEQFNYYPTTGAYSFWAYRVDDAGTGTAGVGEPEMYDANGTATTTEADAKTLGIPFTIDGSQDIMTAVPDEAGDLTKLQTTGNAPTATADKIYTAYSARRNITPKLSFKHQLTRLTFQVKANSIEVSDAAKSAGATATYNGFKVTGIAVKSKTNGKIIAAWKDGGTYNAQTVVFDDANEDWATLNSLTALQLKSRGMEVIDKQTNYWSDQISLAVATDGTVNYTGSYTLGANSYTINNTTGPDLELYDVNTENSYTGLPNGTKKTVSEWLAAYKADPNNAGATAGTYVAGYIKGYAQTVNQPLNTTDNENAAADLLPLVPVIPHWDATYTWTAYTPVATYTWTAANAGAYTPAAGDIELTAAPTSGTVAAGATTTDKAGNDVDATKTYYVAGTGASDATKYTLTISYDSDGCRALAAAPDNSALTADPVVLGTIGQNNEIVKVPGTGGAADAYYKCAVAGNNTGKNTNIGEALLVAPNAPSYDLILTYKRWKATSTNNVSEIEGTVEKTVSRSGGANFAAGDSYNIVITLYKDGDASTDTNLNPWNKSTDGDIEVSGEDE